MGIQGIDELKPGGASPSNLYRKKPVEVEAIQWDGTVEKATEIIDWVLENGGTARYREASSVFPTNIAIDTLEGIMSALTDDWVIKGTQGEFYPCKPRPFADTFEKVI